MKSFAIVVIGYNRLPGIIRLVQSLEKVNYNGRNDIHLIFSIDNSGKTDVENYAQKYHWPHGPKHIRTFPQRQGLKAHILSCGDYTEKYDIIAVLEDDLFVSDSFYFYAYQAADFYFDDDNVAGISLYGFQKNWLDWLLRFEPQKTEFDTYFMKIAQSWGQVWTRKKWHQFKEWYERNKEFTYSDLIPHYLTTWPESSWLKYHTRYCIETNKYFVYPYTSISTNYSDSGEHSTHSSTDHQVELMFGKEKYHFPLFSSSTVKYDEYMDREGLGDYLGIPDEELCVDFWGTKTKRLYKRYLLSLENKKYYIKSEYAFSLRPIELSVICNIKGRGIYLYDTSKSEKHRRFDGKYKRYLYSIRSRESGKLIRFAIKLRIKDVCMRGAAKIKKVFCKK